MADSSVNTYNFSVSCQLSSQNMATLLANSNNGYVPDVDNQKKNQNKNQNKKTTTTTTTKNNNKKEKNKTKQNPDDCTGSYDTHVRTSYKFWSLKKHAAVWVLQALVSNALCYRELYDKTPHPCQSICSVLHFCLPGRILAFLGRFTKLLIAQIFHNKSLKFFACYFAYTLAYDTVSIKFDFVSIWLSMDEYIEYSFQEKCSHRAFTCMLQHSKPTQQGQIVVKI